MTTLALETPAPVVDLDRLERNLSRWQARCDELGVGCRPHIKTHKCVEIARMQVELGARGLTCQTIGEAETMAAAGFDDLLLPTNVLGEQKLARLARLLERASGDGGRGRPARHPRARPGGRELGTAAARCSSSATREPGGWVSRAQSRPQTWRSRSSRAGALRFGGFMTYPLPTGAIAFLAAAVAETARRGVTAETVSVGGTPGMWSTNGLRPTVTEYRAGTYAFHDRNTIAAGAATLDDVALTVCATVVSRPSPTRAILDAGSKSLSSDRSPADGFGLVVEAPASTLVRVDEEHGYLELANGDDLRLGQQVRIVPNHACAVSNLFAEFVLVRDGAVTGRWPIAARAR